MNINEAFPSKYLSADDIPADTPAIISHIDRDEFNDNGQKVMKAILYFRGMDKGIVLNKTNATNISEAYGSETDDWGGQPVVLFTTYVDFQGRSVQAIRVRPDRKKTPPARAPQMTNAAPRGAGTATPPQFDDPADPGFDPDRE